METSKIAREHPELKMKPILFNTEMVRAILEGRKTQTRRVVKPQPHDMPKGAYIDPYNKNHDHFTAWTADHRMCLGCGGSISGAEHWKPRYQPGDVLWVKETWNGDWCDHVIYKADGGSAKEAGYSDEPKWRSSIHMPKEAARIFLQVTDVKVERLQSTTNDDAKKEGVVVETDNSGHMHLAVFTKMWNSIYARRGFGWDTNPWVWVYSFERRRDNEADNPGKAAVPQ